jgi:hypothetical protein
MKILACNLIAIVSVALSSAVFAANLEEGQVTGTIVEVHPPALIVIETAKKQRLEFSTECGLTSKVKVGDKGTLHYYFTGRKSIACTFEKAGKAEKGSKKD